MAAPTLLLYEGFENDVPPASANFVQTISEYDNGVDAPVPGYVGRGGQIYSADSAWNGRFCNGLIISGNDPGTVPVASQAADCLQAGWNQSKQLAETLGLWRADQDYPYPALPGTDPDANHAVTAYTQGDSPPGVMASTTAAATAGHYYTASIDVAQANCWATNPVDISILLSDAVSPPVSVFPGPISACTLPVHQIQGDNVGTFVGLGTLLAKASTVSVSVVNNLGGGGGDDNAFDNVAIIDTTPQLRASIAASPDGLAYPAGQPVRLTLSVTNTHLAGAPALTSGAKPGWSLDLSLPEGLILAPEPRATTDCANATVSTARTTIRAGGDLRAADIACTLAVDVTSTTGGAYTIDPADYSLVGLLSPSPVSTTFRQSASPTPAGPPSPADTGAELADSGTNQIPAIACASLLLALGMGLLLFTTLNRRGKKAWLADERVSSRR